MVTYVWTIWIFPNRTGFGFGFFKVITAKHWHSWLQELKNWGEIDKKGNLNFSQLFAGCSELYKNTDSRKNGWSLLPVKQLAINHSSIYNFIIFCDSATPLNKIKLRVFNIKKKYKSYFTRETAFFERFWEVDRSV